MVPHYFFARLMRSRRGPLIVAAAVLTTSVAIGAMIYAFSDDDATSFTAATSSTTASGTAATSSTRGTSPGSTTANASTSSTAPGTGTTTIPGGATTSSTAFGASTTQGSFAPTTTVAATDLEKKYLQAWRAECNRIWAFSSNGKMYDPDDTSGDLTLNVCLESMDSAFLTATTAETAAEQGRQDARTFLYDSTLSGLVCWIDPTTEEIQGCYDAETNTTGPLTIDA